MGFTLVEILVVMIIMGMVSSILFQALERAYRLQDRFGAELFAAQQGQMTTDWYRQTVQGLRPDYPNGKNIFKGSNNEFSGLTDNSLGKSLGVPTPISWKIRKDLRTGLTELVYIEGQKETVILDWLGSDAHFVYLDAQRSPHDQWPPLQMGPSPQLPQQVQIVSQDKSQRIDIIATPMITARPVMRIQDL